MSEILEADDRIRSDKKTVRKPGANCICTVPPGTEHQGDYFMDEAGKF